MGEHDHGTPDQTRSDDTSQEGAQDEGSLYQRLVDRLGPAGAMRAMKQRRQAKPEGSGAAPQVAQAEGGQGQQPGPPQPAGSLTPGNAASADADTVNSDRGDESKFARLDEKDAGGKQSVGGFRKVYQAGGFEVLVFLPGGGITDPNKLRVFSFFHGHDADYGGDKTDQFDTGGDNPAKAMNMAQAVTAGAPNTIAIMPSAGEHARFKWRDKNLNFEKILDDVLAQLSVDLGLPKGHVLKPASVEIAGHSAGGEAAGIAAGTGGKYSDQMHEVTIEDGGYGFNAAWESMAQWFIDGTPDKKIRVITQTSHKRHQDLEKNAADAGAKAKADPTPENQKAATAAGRSFGNSTRHVVEDGGLSTAAIKQDLKSKKVGKNALKNPKLDSMAVTVTPGDGKRDSDGLTLDYTLSITGDGERKIEVFRFENPDKTDERDPHFAMRDELTPKLLADKVR